MTLNADGFRVVAVAFKEMAAVEDDLFHRRRSRSDAARLHRLPRPAEGIRARSHRGAGRARRGGEDPDRRQRNRHPQDLPRGPARSRRDPVSAAAIAKLNDAELAEAADKTSVFAKLTPAQKERVIQALHAKGHVVGFLGDGINDSPALKAADVGISVDTAVDIAKESADIILLEKNLMVLQKGVIEGRKIFANIVKYIKMGASSNFGNMFSVLGASIFLPFLPMAPIQVLTNNLLYDFSQTAIPTDNVDEEFLVKPRRWDISNIFKFMVYIGPISSIFDYVTYGMMLYVFGAWTNPALFQTGWFVESLLTQTLIIHIIRTSKIPFIESRASPALLTTSLVICVVGIWLPYSWLGAQLGFVPLPALYWPLVTLILLAYAALTHFVKVWFVRKWGL